MSSQMRDTLIESYAEKVIEEYIIISVNFTWRIRAKLRKESCVNYFASVLLGLGSPKNGQRIFSNKLVPMTVIATH
jgi:hypothetical protein